MIFVTIFLFITLFLFMYNATFSIVSLSNNPGKDVKITAAALILTLLLISLNVASIIIVL